MITRCNDMWLMVVLVAGSSVLHAAEPELPRRQVQTMVAVPANVAEGEAKEPSRTEQWLRLQAQGKAASKYPQQATATERELANQRLLDSYGYPIPEYLPRSGADGSSGSAP